MRILFVLISGLLFAAPTFATPYTYNYSANFSHNGSLDGSVYSIADEALAFPTITGTITFWDDILSGSGTDVLYKPAIITFNELTLPVDIAMESVWVLQNSLWDQLAFINETVTALNTNFNSVGLIMRDNDKTALDSPFYPGAIDIDLFETKQLFFMNQRDSGTGFGATERTNFNITSLQLQTASVPEPATLALLGLGLVGVGLSRRKIKA